MPVPYDLDDALGMLAESKHWTIQTVNRKGVRVGYECTLWAGGKRVRAQSVHSPFEAVKRAFGKLNSHQLKLVR